MNPGVAAFRSHYRIHQIGIRYSGWAHFCFTTFGSLAVIVYAILRVHEMAPWEYLVIPGSFVVANMGEYFGHRGPMHHRRRGMSLLFRRHTEQHHRFFTRDAMNYESPRDFKIVLFPPLMLFFFLGCLATPLSLLFYVLLSSNAAWLFVTVAMSYFLTYEWLHFCYHLPQASWVAKLPFMNALRLRITKAKVLKRMRERSTVVSTGFVMRGKVL